VRDGEIVTACQQACPTSAISFGTLNARRAKSPKAQGQERDSSGVGTLNFRPRTTYTRGVINPNPELG